MTYTVGDTITHHCKHGVESTDTFGGYVDGAFCIDSGYENCDECRGYKRGYSAAVRERENFDRTGRYVLVDGRPQE